MYVLPPLIFSNFASCLNPQCLQHHLPDPLGHIFDALGSLVENQRSSIARSRLQHGRRTFKSRVNHQGPLLSSCECMSPISSIFVDRTQIVFQIDDGEVERQRPTVPDILSDGTLAIVAGTDTIKTTLAATFYHLLLNPTCYQHLQCEVDRIFPNPEDPMDFHKLSEMEYLDACMYVTHHPCDLIGG